MNLIWEFLSWFIFLLQILRGFSDPIPCKRGKFYEPNVYDYLDCKVCVEQTHFHNCKTCCGSVTSTTSSASITSSAFTSSKPITPTSTKSLSKLESAKPEPTFHSFYDLKFFFQGTPLVAIIVAFTTGAIFSLVFILPILMLVYRKKVASGPRKPPIEETQTDANSSPFV